MANGPPRSSDRPHDPPDDRAGVGRNGCQVLPIAYVAQEHRWSCGAAVVAMIRRAANVSRRRPWRERSQQALCQELLCRRGLPPEPVDLPLRFSQLNWLLHPIGCQWVRHPTWPRVSLAALLRELDSGRPLILYLQPKSGPGELSSQVPGHVVLLIGYVRNPRGGGRLLLLDPQADSEWWECGETAAADRACGCGMPGHRIVDYERLAAARIEARHDDPLGGTTGVRMRWVATGFLQEFLAY